MDVKHKGTFPSQLCHFISSFLENSHSRVKRLLRNRGGRINPFSTDPIPLFRREIRAEPFDCSHFSNARQAKRLKRGLLEIAGPQPAASRRQVETPSNVGKLNILLLLLLLRNDGFPLRAGGLV